MTIDFGAEIGVKISCGAYRNYAKEELLGKQVVAVVNFAPLKWGRKFQKRWCWVWRMIKAKQFI